MSPVLVSIVMPAYKASYFEAALNSVLSQTYPALELIIYDDSPDECIAGLVEQRKAGAPCPIRYFKNEIRLGELGSTARGIRLAEGRYIKFLHDDDVLEPDCIEKLVEVMERDPSVSLASSRRRRIDEAGEPLPDILATCFPFTGDVLLDGRELVSFLGEHTINFIGEPSCILARREDLLQIVDQLMYLNGTLIHWVGDLALYAKLLQRGNLAFLARPLTNFRVSSSQFSQAGRDQPGIGEKGHTDFRQAIRDLGWLRTSGDNRFVRVAPITQLKARVFKPVNLLAAIQRAGGLGSVPLFAWQGERCPTDAQQALINARLQSVGGGPRFAVIVLDYHGNSQDVERTLVSLESKNLYRNLDVRVLSPETLPDLAGRAEVSPLMEGAAAVAINAATAVMPADWLLVVDAGVEFTVSGLLIAALDLLEAPDTFLAAYADELMRMDDGEHGLVLRPDLNLDMLLSFPAGLSRHWLLKREAFLSNGGYAIDQGSAFELDYQLRLIESGGLACIGHISETLLSNDVGVLQDRPQERAVIERHLRARGYEQAFVGSQLPGRYEVDYGHAQLGAVSILIVVKDRLPQAQRCIETLLQHTDYGNYEILLLDHGNGSADVRSWLAGVEALDTDQLRVIHFDGGLSEAALCNQAAQQARGDFLLWLGDGAGVLGPGWLQQLLNHAMRPEVGAVGGKLLSADGRVHHAGWLLGLRGPAGRAFEGAPFDDAGYMQRLQVDQNYSAVSGECLMVPRELFLQLGGFDEDPLLAPWKDVDLCLRLQQAGYLNVWTPRVQLLMDAPLHAATSVEQETAMYARWLPTLARDPAYNPNFSLMQPGGFKLADPGLAWRPLESWRPLPRILAHPADLSGCGHYRLVQPFKVLEDAGLLEGAMSTSLLPLTELERFQPDVILLQRQVGDERLAAMRRMKAFSSAFKVYELDDYLPNLPLKNAHRQHMPKDILRSLRQGFACVDRFVVSTDMLAEAFAGTHEQIRVIRNMLPTHWWGDLKSQRRTSARPRVGWAGGAGHTGDLEMIIDVVKELAGEVDWVFFGMCPEAIRPLVKEFHAGVDINRYPQALAALNLDLALAPVEQNLFNECKSNLRLLEYGACGFPVISSDVRCYQGTLPVTRVKNRFRDWVDAIRMHVADLDACAQAGDALRSAVRRDWMLEGENLRAWRAAWLPD